jgi:hemerythrin
MRQYYYPDLEEHLKLHTEFLDEYSKLPNKFSEADSNQTLADQITEIVQKEVTNHIAQADMEFGRFVNSQDSSKIT